MLSVEYKEALQAMKDQAAVAAKMLETHSPAGELALKSELSAVHIQIALRPAECKRIVKLLLSTRDAGLTIDTLDEARLAAELHL